MNRCLLGHDWDGCTCRRCGEARDTGHEWDRCACARCGLKRNHGHDWELLGCHQRCRRCHWPGEAIHDWDGCRCRRCSATQHAWSSGFCERCGAVCDHAETTSMLGGADDGETFQGRLIRVCKQCGLALGEVWRK